MRKALVGLIAAIVVAIGGYFGFELYMQHRVASEVEAAFEQIRNAGGKASHGTVSYDPWKRTLSIADIASESATNASNSIKIARLTASNIGQPEPNRFSADLIEATDVEIGFVLFPEAAHLEYSYKIPKIVVTDYSGTPQIQRLPASSSAIDLYQFAVAQFARIRASSVSVPNLFAAMKLPNTQPTADDFAYSGLTMQGIQDGKIATANVERVTLIYHPKTAGRGDSINGTLANLVLRDFDATAEAAMLDPQKANDVQRYQLYRQISIGECDFTSRLGLHTRIGGITIDDVGISPSRLQIAALLEALPPSGTAAAPAQAEMLEKLAGFFEGLDLGNFEAHGISIDTPQGPAKLASVQFNLDNGKTNFRLDGLDIPKGPVKLAHFELKSLDMAKLMRLSASMPGPGQRRASGQALALFDLIAGAEIKELAAPYLDTGKQINIDSFSLNWDPTQVHLNAKLHTPFSAGPTPNIDADLGAAWTEASGIFALDPVTLELGGQAKAQARLSLTNVPRGVFTSDPQQAAAMSAQIEAGALELTLQDLGGVDVMFNEFARKQQISRDAARSTFINAIKQDGDKAASANPDAEAVLEAVTRFVETPRQTLVIKLTPLSKVPALQLVQQLKADLWLALTQFKIEASTGL